MKDAREKGLSAWQLTMMAVGTVIGGSFFLGSSVAIHAAGPSVLLAYIIGGVLTYFILFALSEMTVANPGYGSFRTFAAQAFGQGTGFVVGWVYWLGLALGMSSEATAISILVRTWLPKVPISLMGAVIIIGVTLLNLLGADQLSKLESGLAGIKIFAVAAFIAIGLFLIAGLFPGARATGRGSLAGESLMPGGVASIAGSMLVVMFAYSGFEIIGLAASEAKDPKETVPRSIRRTVFILVGLYILTAAVLLPLIPTSILNENVSPMVAALDRHGIGWAGNALNIVLVTAILSTMLASVFGLGRIFRSLADDGFAPGFLKDHRDVPYRGILFSGAAMLAGLGLGLLFPSVYLFLVSSGGFAMLFTYAVIMASHIRFRRRNGCPPDGKCQMWGYPYSSVIVLIALILSIFSMPFVPGQGSGLVAGIVMVAFFAVVYAGMKVFHRARGRSEKPVRIAGGRAPDYLMEASNDLGGAGNRPSAAAGKASSRPYGDSSAEITDNNPGGGGMQRKIAVESNLTPVKDYLAGKGYQVECVDFNRQSSKNLDGYDAFVVTGINKDFLGVEDTQTKAPVINASGMTPEDVAKELSRRI